LHLAVQEILVFLVLPIKRYATTFDEPLILLVFQELQFLLYLLSHPTEERGSNGGQ